MIGNGEDRKVTTVYVYIAPFTTVAGKLIFFSSMTQNTNNQKQLLIGIAEDEYRYAASDIVAISSASLIAEYEHATSGMVATPRAGLIFDRL